jgi:hypothetical protein
MQNDAGMLTNYHKDGSSSVAMGTAESSTGYNIGASDRLENIASQSIAHEKSLAQSKGLQAQQFEARGFESILQNHRNIESSKQFQEQFSAEERDVIRHSNTKIDEFAKTHNISRVKAAELFANNGAGLGFRGNVSSEDRKLYEEVKKYNEEHQISKDLHIAKQAMQSNHLNLTDNQGQSINEDFRKSTQLSQEQSIHLENAKHYSQQKQFIESNSASIDKTYNQEFYNYVKTNLAGGNTEKAADLFNPNNENRHEVLDKSAAKFLEDKFHKTNISQSFDQDYKYQATRFLNQNAPKNLMQNEAPPHWNSEFKTIDNSNLKNEVPHFYDQTKQTIDHTKLNDSVIGEVKREEDRGVLGGFNLINKEDIDKAFEKKNNQN